MKVRELMTHKVVTCWVDETLKHAAQRMWDYDIGVLPVLQGNRVVGMVTDRDIAMAAYLDDRPLSELTIENCMSNAIYLCGPDDDLVVAEEQMAQHGVRRLPVLDGETLVGLLSLNDLARAIAAGAPISSGDIARTLGALSTPRPVAGANPI